MNKDKFLHRHGTEKYYYLRYYNRKSIRKNRYFKNFKNLSLSEISEDELIDNFNIPKKRKDIFDRTIDLGPLIKFLESKNGNDWDEIYSEILKKTKKKFRKKVNSTLKYHIYNPIYDDKFLPLNKYGKILNNVFFINLDGKLVKMTKSEILLDSLKRLRRHKLLNLYQ